MCYKAPGPRCASHTRKTVVRDRKKVFSAAQALNAASAALESAEDSGKVTDSLIKNRREAFDTFVSTRRTYHRSVREYIATPTGLKDYQSKVEQARAVGDADKVESLKRTIQAASAIRGWRQNALIKMKESGEVPVSKRQKFNNDGSLKLVAEEGDIAVRDSTSPLDGPQYTRSFSSVDKLSTVTYSVQASPRYEPGDDRAWGYAVKVMGTSYSSFSERDGEQMPSTEAWHVTQAEDNTCRRNSLDKASAAAYEHLRTLDASAIRWDGASKSLEHAS